jgi:hypothetical protein
MPPLRKLTTALLATSLLGIGASTAFGAVDDPDGDGDLVCPPGATNASYCTEDESGPQVDISPSSVTLTRGGAANFKLTCRAPAGNRCLGTLSLTRRERVVRRGRRPTFRTVNFGSKSFSITAGQPTTVGVPISGRGRIQSAPGRKLSVTATVVARFADNRNRTSTRTVTLKAPAGRR